MQVVCSRLLGAFRCFVEEYWALLEVLLTICCNLLGIVANCWEVLGIVRKCYEILVAAYFFELASVATFFDIMLSHRAANSLVDFL